MTLPAWVDALLTWFVQESRDPSELRKRKILVGLTLTILSWTPLYAAFYLAVFPPPYGWIAVGGLVMGMGLVAIVPLVIRFGGPIGVCVGLLGFSLSGLLLLTASMTGGYRSPLMPWMVLHPLLALGLGGIRLAWVWTACVFGQLLALAVMDQAGVRIPELLSPAANDMLWATTLVTITMTVFLVGWVYESVKNQTIRDLERASQAKTDFLAHMSHEIRTPMTAILGFADILEDEKLSHEQRDHLRTIRRNGEHLLALINDILDLSRVEAGRVELEFSSVRPAELLREVAGLVQPRLRERGLELKVEIDPSADSPIRSDARRLQQVLINLAGNAAKFTSSGYVRLAVRADAQFVRFEVEDTGPGIARDKQAEIFEAFTQADASMSRRFGGTGLGLAISRKLAQLLGGDVGLRSEPGRGSTFWVEVPSVSAAPGPQRAAAPVVDTEAPLSGRVLLAEDGPDSRRLIDHLLRRWGLEVELAENGAIALDRARAASARGRPFDLVLMDMQMPELDGYEATRRLRAEGYTGRVVALTAHAMEGSREECLQAGCDDYLTKPIDRPALRALIATALAARSA